METSQQAPILVHKQVQVVSLSGWQSFLLNLLAVTSLISMGLLAVIVAFAARIGLAVHTPNDGGGATYNWMRVGQVNEG